MSRFRDKQGRNWVVGGFLIAGTIFSTAGFLYELSFFIHL